MAYALLNDRIVCEIIPEYSDIFPDMPISQRYPTDFLEKLIVVGDDVKIGMEFKEDENFGYPTFSEVTEELSTPTFEEIQEEINLDIDFRITCIELGI